MTAPRIALVFAGGLGSRIAADRPEVPKPLLPVRGVPLLAWTWLQLERHGIREVHLALRHRAAELRDYVERHLARPGMTVHFHVEESPLGTIGALSWLRTAGEPVLTVNGDLLSGIALDRLGAAHGDRQADLTVATHWQQQRLELGEVVCSDDETVRGYREKPVKRYRISSGTYVVSPSVLRLLGEPTWLPFPELVETALHAGLSVRAFDHGNAWLDVNDLDALRRAEQALTEDPIAFGIRPEELDAAVLRLGVCG